MNEKLPHKQLKKYTDRAYWLGVGLGLVVGLLLGIGIGYSLGSPQAIVIPLQPGIET